MKKVGRITPSITIAMLLVHTILLVSLITTAPVAATAINFTPIDQTIPVLQNETFVLPFMMTFQEDAAGYFGSTFYWDVNETDPNGKYWNFTYEGFKCWFVDGTNFTATIYVSITKDLIPPDYTPGNYRYTISIYEYDGEPYGTAASPAPFWLNVTMRAAGQGASYIPHSPGDQNITISKVRCYEDSQVEAGPGDSTIHVEAVGVHDVAVIGIARHCGKTVVAKGYSTTVDVTVENQGTYTETFDVTLYYGNSTGNYTMGTETASDLSAGQNTTLTFTFDTTNARYCVYSLVAIAEEVFEELDTADNTLIEPGDPVNHLSGYTVTIAGDIDGDGYVYVLDLSLLGGSWRLRHGHILFNSNADIDCDDYVYVLDLSLLGANWRRRVTISS